MSEINIVLFEAHRQEALATISELPYPLSINRAIQDCGELLREWVKVQAVLTAAEEVNDAHSKSVLDWRTCNLSQERISALRNLRDAVRTREEMEAKK